MSQPTPTVRPATPSPWEHCRTPMGRWRVLGVWGMSSQ